jgi:hypothetical protein
MDARHKGIAPVFEVGDEGVVVFGVGGLVGRDLPQDHPERVAVGLLRRLLALGDDKYI